MRSGKPIENLYDRIAKEKGIKYIKDIKFPMLVTATNVVDEKEYIFKACVQKNKKRNDLFIAYNCE